MSKDSTTELNDWVGEPTEVTEEVVRSCKKNGQLPILMFKLYNETARLVVLSGHLYVGNDEGEGAFRRNQAICAGLIIRISKFMLSVMHLMDGHERGEVILALSRSIVESATNLRFLLMKNEDKFFDQFVKFSLGPEREFYDLVLSRIKQRGGDTLVIEQRILASINYICKASGMEIVDVDSKYSDWGGGLRNRLEALGLPERYVLQQRMPSHAVHGTWVDLLLHHLDVTDHGFKPNPDWASSDGQMLSSVSLCVIEAVQDYLKFFFSDETGIQPFYDRLNDLQNRILMVETAHEDWSLSGEQSY